MPVETFGGGATHIDVGLNGLGHWFGCQLQQVINYLKRLLLPIKSW